MRLHWVIAVCAVALSLGCKKRDYSRCDDTHACQSGQRCNANFYCEPISNDMAMDLAGADFAGADLAGSDAGPDAAEMGPMCSGAGDCTDVAQPICDTGSQHCRACATAADDGQCVMHSQVRCLTEGTNAGKCGACRTANNTSSADCIASMPICDVTGICRKCQSHDECPSKVCLDNGSCADQTTIVYVNNANGTCTGTHPGTIGDPACDIASGIGLLMSNQTTVRVIGSTAPYAPFTFSPSADKTLTLVGPGGDAATPATIYQMTSNGATMNLGSGNVSLTVDGFVFGDPSVTTTQYGLFCSNGGTGTVSLTLRRSIVRNSGKAGVYASGCNLTMDQDKIGPGNVGGGITVAAGQYSITNAFVFNNVSTLQAAVSLDPGGSDAMHAFKYNTVASNTNAGGVGGINVKSGSALITDSIIWGNSKTGSAGSMTQMAGTFTAAFVDIDDDTTPTGTGNRKSAPTFVSASSPYDYHLSGMMGNNPTCCIDQIDSSNAGGVTHDYDGRPRPQPSPAGKWDIGAHEVPQ